LRHFAGREPFFAARLPHSRRIDCSIGSAIKPYRRKTVANSKPAWHDGFVASLPDIY
jgi:hypothetical protein